MNMTRARLALSRLRLLALAGGLSLLLACGDEGTTPAPADSGSSPSGETSTETPPSSTEPGAPKDDPGPEAKTVDDGPVAFENVSLQAGIDFQHDYCGNGARFMVETNSSGLGWLDYDRDGHLDLYFSQGAPVPGVTVGNTPLNKLYRNRGDGTFEEVAEKAGVADAGIGMGVACPDFDGDGWPDIYLCNYGANKLYQNNGDGTFTDVTEKAGVGDTRWSSSALFADFDGDADLDLFVVNYVDFAPERKVNCGQTKNGVFIPMYCHPDAYEGLPESVYRNNGDGTFTDVSEECGVRDVSYKRHAKGLCVVPSDYDDDGDLDVFVANDATPNFLFRNEGNLKFKNVAMMAGVAFNGDGKTESCMGSDWADVDHDGDFDLMTCNIQQESNTLWINNGGFFEDRTYQLKLGRPGFLLVGFSVEFFDFDNDADQDVFISNGHMIDNIEEFDDTASFEQYDHLYANLGTGKGFKLVSADMGGYFNERFVGRSAAVGDYDNDGDYDLAINNMGGPGLLIRNNVGQDKSWIGFRLEGTVSHPSAIGARVQVRTGDLVQVEEIRGTVALGSYADLRLLFGLGEREKVDSITIRWPSGTEQTLEGLAVRQYHTIREPTE